MEQVGIGLIGCGVIGQIHADGLAKLTADGDVRPIVAADPSDAGRSAVLANCPFETTTADAADAMRADGLDAVVIASPTLHHPDAIEAALDRGVPLFCEKPLAVSFDEVRELVSVVEAAHAVAQVGFHSRFNPLFCQAKEMVDDGSLGRVLGYVLREDQFWPTGKVVDGHSSWRSDVRQAGGGALLEHTIHGCDLVSWIFGPASSVSARTRSLFGFGVEDIAVAHVEHDTGTIGTITSVFNGVEGREERRLEIFFEHGTVEITSDFVVGAPEDAMVIHRPRRTPERAQLEELREGWFARWGIQRRDFLFYQYLADRSFVRCVREGRPAVPDFGDALRAHAIVDAAYRSASDGGRPAETNLVR